MKRILHLLLVLALMLCLCACGDTTPAETTKPSPEDYPHSATTVPAADATTLPAETTVAPTEDSKVTYTVKVVDESGKALAGVAVQLCDAFCVFASTDAEGVATFKLEEGGYHASIMALPEGYAHVGDQVEFDFADGSTEMTITLKAAG